MSGTSQSLKIDSRFSCNKFAVIQLAQISRHDRYCILPASETKDILRKAKESETVEIPHGDNLFERTKIAIEEKKKQLK